MVLVLILLSYIVKIIHQRIQHPPGAYFFPIRLGIHLLIQLGVYYFFNLYEKYNSFSLTVAAICHVITNSFARSLISKLCPDEPEIQGALFA